jgi:REP element-mobilizing transposase RayT
MSRKPRIEFTGAIYHVMSRGNRREPIFLDDRDCGLFLETLGEACAKTGWLVHAFVLMGNHYHLLLETPEANLVTGMKWLQGTYTQRFNSRHRLFGHLLQGRYKALVIDREGGKYFQTVGGYVHLNPARARLFDLKEDSLEDYKWSSYPLYLQPNRRPSWLAADRLLGSLGTEDHAAGRKWFRDFMQNRVAAIAKGMVPDDDWKEIRRGWCLGSESFRVEMLQKIDVILEGKKRSSYNGEEVKHHDEAEAERYLVEGMAILGLNKQALHSLKKGAKEKAILAWYIRANTTVSRRWLAERLVIGDESRVSRMAGDAKRNKEYADLRSKLQKLHDSRTDP